MDNKLEYLPIVYKVTDPDNKPEEVQHIYSAWATEYDKDLIEKEQYCGPEQIVSHLNDVVADKSVKIFDIGVGTGLVGVELQKHGYLNIDGIDPNEAMLDVAKKTNAYKKLHTNYVGKNKLNIPNDTYDVIVGSGVFVPGHITWEAFPELHRITKAGGIIIIAVAERYSSEEFHDYGNHLENEIKLLEAKGVWKREQRKSVIYHGSQNAIVSILRIF